MSSSPAPATSSLRSSEADSRHSSSLTFTATADDAGQRLDSWLARETGLSRNQLQHALDEGRVTLERGGAPRASTRVVAALRATVVLVEPTPPSAEPQAIPLDIVYEDGDVVVVNKPSGLVVHPAPGHRDGTLVNALLHHCVDLAGVGGALRPGIVHRLDKETSGLLVATKNDATHRHLQRQFAEHTISREYVALCARLRGAGLEEQTTFRTAHGRDATNRKRFTGSHGLRHAVTHVTVLERFTDGAMLVACELETGRTHQIRMHLAEHGCPIFGDALYGGRAIASAAALGRVGLHARRLGFTLLDGRALEFTAPLPDDLAAVVDRLRSGVSWRR